MQSVKFKTRLSISLLGISLGCPLLAGSLLGRLCGTSTRKGLAVTTTTVWLASTAWYDTNLNIHYVKYRNSSTDTMS